MALWAALSNSYGLSLDYQIAAIQLIFRAITRNVRDQLRPMFIQPKSGRSII